MQLHKPRYPILVTGAFGMLGSYFEGERFFRTGRKDLDIRDVARLRHVFAQEKFSAILHLAALTNLEYCEKNPAEAEETHATATGHLARLSQEYSTPMIYISTAGIFSGNPKQIYDEDDDPLPLSVYARTKYAGEKALLSAAPRSLVIRIGWLMGGVEKDHKFVGAVARKMLDSSSTFKNLQVVNDTRGSLLYAKDLSQIIWRFLRGQTGEAPTRVLHVSNSGTCSRFEIAQALAHGLKRKVKLVPVSSAKYGERIVPRPLSEILVSKYWPQIAQAPLRHWRLALDDYLTEWAKQNVARN